MGISRVSLIKGCFISALIVCFAGFLYFHPFLSRSSSVVALAEEQAAIPNNKQTQLERTHSRLKQAKAATELLKRLLPERADDFKLELFSNAGFAAGDSPLSKGPDVFELSSEKSGLIIIRGVVFSFGNRTQYSARKHWGCAGCWVALVS